MQVFSRMNEIPDPVQFQSITLVEMLMVISNKKAPGLDGITYSMLKNFPLSANIKLLSFYNDLLQWPQIPPKLKEGLILPFCKIGKSPNVASSYRPIALTSTILKVFETCVALLSEEIYKEFLNETKLQYRFRRKIT